MNTPLRLTLFFIILSLILFTQNANAQTRSFNGNIYIYPASLITSILIAPSNEKDKEEDSTEKKKDRFYFTNLYLTIEFYTLTRTSLIITPSYQGWNYHGTGINSRGNMNHDRIGGDLGFRFYTSEQHTGFFLQATGGAYYFHRHINYYENPYPSSKYSAALYQVMGHAGFATEYFTISVGAGYNKYRDNSLSYNHVEEKKDIRNNLAQRGRVFDISFAVGLKPSVAQ